MKPHVVIIGAGIAGLSTALAFSRKGVPVRVSERAEVLRPLGAGLSLWPNAMRCLRLLGIADRLIEACSVVERLQFRTKDGQVLKDVPLCKLSEKLGAPTICVHRADLQHILLEPLKPEVVGLGKECVEVAVEGNEAIARFHDGTIARADLLIGADGINSRVRAHLLRGGPPRYAGYGAALGVTEFPDDRLAAGLAFESWGVGDRFGCWPCGQGRLYWYFSANRPVPFEGVVPGNKADLLGRARGWHEPVRAIIESTKEERILNVSSFDRRPVASWSGDRITLAGDAAHPMTPNLGQGACQAIEDAMALAQSLAEASGVAEGLRLYEERRIKRASRLMRQARRFGVLAQTENRLLCWLWKTVTKWMPLPLVLRQLESHIVGLEQWSRWSS